MRGGFPAAAEAACIGSDFDKWGNSHTVDEADSEGNVNAVVAAAAAPDSFRTADSRLAA